MNPALEALLSARLVPVTGKGGVGKSTVCAALALAAARTGRRVLVAEVLGQSTVPRLLGHPNPAPERAHEVRQLERNIWSVNLAPYDSMREFVLKVVRYEFIYKAVFENRIVRRFLRFVPSLGELTMFGKVWFHEGERADGSNASFDTLVRGVTHAEDGARAEELTELEAGLTGPGGDDAEAELAEAAARSASAGRAGGDASRPQWDVVLLDLPATGHGLAFLRAPAVVKQAAPAGQMHRIAEALDALLREPGRCKLVVVTLAAEMPVNEALEIGEVAERELGVEVGAVVANGVYAPLLPAQDAPALETLRAAAGAAPRSPVIDAVLGAARSYERRRTVQRAQLARLGAGLRRAPRFVLPYLFEERFGRRDVEVLATRLALSGGGAAELGGDSDTKPTGPRGDRSAA